MIPFNIPCFTGNEIKYLKQVIRNKRFSGDGEFTRKCNEWLEKRTHCKKALLTTSCTHALEMTAVLSGIKKGDEVIMPSFTFSSTANAFILRGARIVFVDIRPDTMNIDEKLIEAVVTDKTKAIIPVHYAGISCEMDKISAIAEEYNLLLIEDAAQGLMSSYKGKPLGTIGDMGCYSFHESKNYTCGEGGAIILNNKKFIERAEIIREKGTNRSKFWRGAIDKYTWVDCGSSYLPGELNAAFLYAQLKVAGEITKNRLKSWNLYYKGLQPLAQKDKCELPFIPKDCKHNGHMFYIKLKNSGERNRLIEYLKKNKINAVFHYIPLHTSAAGKRYGKFCGKDKWTTKESERILRLPMYYGLKANDIEKIVCLIKKYFE